MAVFTTNWYLYKTHFDPISTKSQIRNFRTATEVYGSKTEKVIPFRKWRLTEKNEL